MKPIMITLWVKPSGLRKHKGYPKLTDIKVTNRLAQLADRVILQGDQYNHLVKDPMCPSKMLSASGTIVGLGRVGPELEIYANYHARHWRNDGALSQGVHENRFGGEVVVVFDGGDDVSILFDGLIQNNEAVAKINAIRDALKLRNHLKQQHLPSLNAIPDSQKLILAVKPIAKEYIERGINLIDSFSEMELDCDEMRAILAEAVVTVLDEEGL